MACQIVNDQLKRIKAIDYKQTKHDIHCFHAWSLCHWTESKSNYEIALFIIYQTHYFRGKHETPFLFYILQLHKKIKKPICDRIF